MKIHKLDKIRDTLLTCGAGEYSDGGGLYLVVTGIGGRSWMVRYQFAGKPAKVGLGSLADRSLDEARDLAADVRRKVRDGIDPKQQRPGTKASVRSTPIFLDFAIAIAAKKKAGLKNVASKRKWDRVVNVYCKTLHNKQLHQITVDDIEACLDAIWLTKPGAASDCRIKLEQIFEIAMVKGHRDRNERNIASWKGNLRALMPKQPKPGSVRGKHKALPYKDMPAFIAELRERDEAARRQLGAKALLITILTGARTNEIQQMQWDQLKDFPDGPRPRWIIPGKVMKNGLEADVPLVSTVIRLLREIRSLELDAKYVFPGDKRADNETMSNNTMLKLLKVDMGREATVHGMRAAFRTWGQNETAHEREVLEYCLHHIEGEEAELAYARGDMWGKRLAALRDWEAYCTTRPAPARPDLRIVA